MAEQTRGTPWLLVSHRVKHKAGKASSPVIPSGAENPLWEVQSSLSSLGYLQKMQSQLSKAEKDQGLHEVCPGTHNISNTNHPGIL